MEKSTFDKGKLIKYWIDSSDEDYQTMQIMFKSKRFSWALFLGHLMVEKLLKALYVKILEDYPPFVHNLMRLSDLIGLELTEEQKVQLATITAFNINARYDDYKMSFQKRCTKDYTELWLYNLIEIRKWIKEQLLA